MERKELMAVAFDHWEDLKLLCTGIMKLYDVLRVTLIYYVCLFDIYFAVVF